MNITENEYVALRHLSACKDNKTLDTAKCEELTDAQYITALRSLKEKGMIRAAFVEGGSICGADIKQEGQAELDNRKKTADRTLKAVLRELDISKDQYQLLKQAEDNGKSEITLNLPEDDMFELRRGCYRLGYIEYDGRLNVLTRKGASLLNDIDDLVLQRLFPDSDVEDNEEHVLAKRKQKRILPPSGIHIADRKVSDFIKVIWAMGKDGIFVDQSGKPYPIKTLMGEAAKFFNCEGLNNYSQNFSRAMSTNSESTLLDVLYRLEDILKAHHNHE